MAAIDVGVKPSVDSADAAAKTWVNRDNPANLSGKITTIDITCFNDVTGLKVAIFENVGGNNLTARDVVVIGDLAAGLHEGIAVDLDVEAGDYIGYYVATGNGSCQTVTGSGTWQLAGDHTECVDTTFGTWTSVSYLWGDGAEAAGWSGKISGVTNPAKVMGVDVANIAKVKGIA